MLCGSGQEGSQLGGAVKKGGAQSGQVAGVRGGTCAQLEGEVRAAAGVQQCCGNCGMRCGEVG